MTATQKARRAGFNASLAQRGVSLLLEGTDFSFDALVEPVIPDAGQFSLSEATRDASKIHVLRDATGVDQITVGSVLNDDDSGKSHRVAKVDDHPTNIVLVFHCETA
jgi:hypothetical protein